VWLVHDGIVLASVEIASDRPARRRGLLGRDDLSGVLVLTPCRQVHTFGMKFPIDVAFCAASGEVLHMTTLRPGRVSRVVWRARFAIEAPAGSFDKWDIRVGDVMELKG
jgi:uncharacterized membrane protein (UPF0127 family)